MDTQTIALCVIGFFMTLVIWLIKASQRRIEKRIDHYERKNEAEHAKLSEALAQQGKDFHAALAQQGKEHREALAQQGKDFHAALAEHSEKHREALDQQSKELHAALAQQGKDFHAALAQQGKEHREALAQQGKEHREALAQQGKEHREALAQQGEELTALRVEVAKLTVPTERELLDSLRQLTMGSGLPERKLPEGD